MVGLNLWWRDTRTADCKVYEVKGELSGVVILKICLQRSRICVEYCVTGLLLGLEVCSTAICRRPDQPIQNFPSIQDLFISNQHYFYFCCKGCDFIGAQRDSSPPPTTKCSTLDCQSCVLLFHFVFGSLSKAHVLWEKSLFYAASLGPVQRFSFISFFFFLMKLQSCAKCAGIGWILIHGRDFLIGQP